MKIGKIGKERWDVSREVTWECGSRGMSFGVFGSGFRD